MPAALTRPSRRPCARSTSRQHPVPVAFGRDVEGVIDAAVAREIGRDRDTALAFHRRGNGLTDGAGGARDQHDLVLETGHAGPR